MNKLQLTCLNCRQCFLRWPSRRKGGLEFCSVACKRAYLCRIRKPCQCGCGQLANKRSKWITGHHQIKSLPSKFWSKVKVSDGCWIWTGATSAGYGVMNFRGKVIGAHRISWELHNGTIPDNMHVLHKCDIRCCVNPAHLFIGTNQDNILDSIKKNRRFRKFTPQEVEYLLSSTEPISAIAEHLGKTRHAVWQRIMLSKRNEGKS
jgi:hypothetical protein